MGDRQPRPAFEYFSVYRMSVLCVGDAQKRDVGVVGGGGGGGEFFISKKRGNKREKSHGIWFGSCHRNVIM